MRKKADLDTVSTGKEVDIASNENDGIRSGVERNNNSYWSMGVQDAKNWVDSNQK